MANNFRDFPPQRTCTKTYANYRSFKSYLAKDFNNRCGYSDCPDIWFGGSNNFHIDHFIPWKNYPANPNLKTDYANLVYCCSYINIVKSNDEGDYIDPCNADFNLHFIRDRRGSILPKPGSIPGNYMYKSLKLFMLRYQIIWVVDRLFRKMNLFKSAIESSPDGELKNSLLITQGELANLMVDYLNYLHKN